MTRRARAFAAAACCLLAGLAVSGCRRDMQDQPKYKPLASTDFFEDGRSARQPVEGTVARGQLREDEFLYTGKIDGAYADEFPFPVTTEVMSRGRERFDIYCSPCHSRVGDGRGMVVRRGFPQAASLHEDRLVKKEAGYIFDVASNGFGRMYGYAAQVPVEDRWAIVAYVRALQLSQHASLSDVPPAARDELEKEGPSR